jgi:glycosyltransferase involved in cell wall biosynthesis
MNMPADIVFNVEEPVLAIVIPVFKHSVLLTEAIESALEQHANFPFRIVIVNDGCPFEETHQVCLAYARSYPHVVRYIRKRNGGLSAARNTGIEYSLKEWPSMKAIYLLDADNRISPYSMQRAMDTLQKNGFKGWVYPDIDMFGYQWEGDYSGNYLLLTHTAMNICEAGSLISRDLLEKGARFDESMKLGYEDWEFWLQAIEQGDKGIHCPNFGFSYRKRAESMLSDSTRDNEEIVAYMRRKHKKLFSIPTLLQLEQSESPRYAIFFADTLEVIFTTDPSLEGRRLTMDEFDEECWRSIAAPGVYAFPGFLLTTTRKVFDVLKQNRLLHWAFWRLERAVDEGVSFAFARLLQATKPGELRAEQLDAHKHPGSYRNADLGMMKIATVQDVLKDRSTRWVDSLHTVKPDMHIFSTQIYCDLGNVAWRGFGRAASTLHSCLMDLRGSIYAQSNQKRWNWKQEGIPQNRRDYYATRLGARIDRPLFPLLRDTEKRDVAFILPFIAFGGVEKVAFAIAKEMARAGWRIHLVVLHPSEALLHESIRSFVTSVIFIQENPAPNWDGKPFLGTNNDSKAQSDDQDMLFGVLAGMNLVINCHAGASSGVMSRLRRADVKTGIHLHVIDLTDRGRPVGHPYLGLAYEHAYDYFLTCSHQLANWLHGMGVPDAKLVPIPNAAGYELDGDDAESFMIHRDYAVPSRPLRVLFLGRLDRQKGLERVVESIRIAKLRGLNFEWKIVGGNVVDSSEAMSEMVEIIDEYGLPPVHEPVLISKLYAWADVLLIPSHWEGLPLTIIEAMRLGCVPLATDVGAVTEIVNHNIDGIVLEQFDPNTCVDSLVSLFYDGIRLRELSEAAVKTSVSRTWESAIARFSYVYEGQQGKSQ